MDSANWAYVAAGRDFENVYFWIGDVTIADQMEQDYGRTYTNVVLVYNVYTQVWTVFTGWNARVWFYDEERNRTFFGTAAGKCVRINSDYADVDGATTTPISFEIIFTPEDMGYPEKDKEFGLIKVVGQYESDVLVADSYDKLVSKSELNQKESAGTPTCKQLWVGVNEEYTVRPPRIEGLILDKVNLLDDAS